MEGGNNYEVAKHVPRCMLEFWLDPESPYFKKDISIRKKS